MRFVLIFVVFSLLAACATAPAPRTGAFDGDGPVVLVTHPTPRVMRRMQTLLDEGLLAIPDVRVVGVSHANEVEPYEATDAYVERTGRLAHVRLDCSIDSKTLFQHNGCTEEFEKLIARSVGIVFPGGPDIPPRLYGEPTLLTTVLDTPRRIAWEASLLYHLVGRGEDDGTVPLLARRPEYPVLAICMGMQALNVATGGTLIQDIPSELYGKKTYEEVLEQSPAEVHRNVHYQLNPVPGVSWASFHPIRLVEGGSLARLASGTPSVLSAHHQAAEKIGAGLRVIATSMDGKVVEAVEHETFHNVLGVQFHPDYLVLWDPVEPFAEHEGDAVTNIASERMRSDALSRAFNRAIWELFSKRAASE